MKAAIVLVASLACTSIAAAQMSPPTPVTAAQFAASTIGERIVMAVRVDRFIRTQLDAELLEQITESRYRAGHARLTLYVPPETPFVMGSIGDLRPGAVLFVYAVTTSATHADVKKIIVVTPYATIE